MTRVISCVPIGNSGDYEGGWCVFASHAFAPRAFAPRALASDYKSTGTALATVRTTTKPLVSAKVNKIAALTSRCRRRRRRRRRRVVFPSCRVHYGQLPRHLCSFTTAHALQNLSTPCPGPAPLNLEIPPYVFMTDTKVKCTALIHARAAASSRRNHLTRL